MSIKSKIIIGAMLFIGGAGAYGGFEAGTIYQRHLDEREAVANDAGHYNAKSAAFAWGSPEDAGMDKLDLAEWLGDHEAAPVPKHKPPVPGRKP